VNLKSKRAVFLVDLHATLRSSSVVPKARAPRIRDPTPVVAQ
jgi:hypothetical protein